ncbi:MAG: zinc ribbon domain-containing protein [Acidobacteria bacterium]|nr:zinc ribbon domain-containing protein [Acidobacteriota bacterium]MCZ6726977.1 zinc ribbon domain-containing protein [Acidobacteriota bacterium]
MPIYEFYCSACHTLLNFFSATVDTDRRPDCPRCEATELERRPARFATLSGSAEEANASLEGLDDARMEQAMAAMAGELEATGEDEDPRQMARLMRRFGEASGLEMSEQMESFVSRLEAGEDPDHVEQELEGLGDDAGMEDLFRLKRGQAGHRARPPRLDDELYFF